MAAPAYFDIYLEEGSLNVVVEEKEEEQIVCDLGFGDDCGELGPEGGGKEPSDRCLDDDFCEQLLDDSSPDQDVSGEIFEEIVVPELDDGFDRPLISVDQLARLLGSGLTPRNVDAAGRGLQAYNNVLADTIFERHPLRQFQPVEVEPAVVEANAPDAVEDSVAEPVRGLWSKNAPIGDAEANEFVEAAIQPLVMAEADLSVEMPHASTLQFSEVVLSEGNSLTAQYAQRDGWRLSLIHI